MKDVLDLMLKFAELKATARTGWNMKFAPESRFKTRKVDGAESVADHSWSVAIFALLMADRLKLDGLKIVWMALVHDVAESVTLDIVTATLDGEERARVEKEKRRKEDEAMRQIFLPMGEWGKKSYALWLEYESGTSPEARLLKQIDKIEVCIQAHVYSEGGHRVNPKEFFDSADPYMLDKEFVTLMAQLRQRAGV